jgi:hypothetical protein
MLFSSILGGDSFLSSLYRTVFKTFLPCGQVLNCTSRQFCRHKAYKLSTAQGSISKQTCQLIVFAMNDFPTLLQFYVDKKIPEWHGFVQ